MRILFLAPLLGLGLWLSSSLAGCSDQSEGDRCELANGDLDCATGLRCTPRGELGGNIEADLCCPPARASATVAACKQGGGTGGPDASIPPSRDGAAADTGVDSGAEPETGAEAGPDAPPDGPSGG